MSAATCQNCGCDSLASGSLLSSGLIKFRPETARFLSFRTADIGIASEMCRSCGAISLRGDTEKLRSLEVAKPDNQAAAEAGS